MTWERLESRVTCWLRENGETLKYSRSQLMERKERQPKGLILVVPSTGSSI